MPVVIWGLNPWLFLVSLIVYSQHVLLADEAYPMGSGTKSQTYLDDQKILQLAKKAKVCAIHPGYGFMSENADFAKKVSQAGIEFIGPSPKNILDMGDKLSAIKKMKEAGVPCVPGSDGPVNSLEEAKKVAQRIGYPLMIKATAGGGGKGMRIVLKPGELESSYRQARSEGLNYFKNDTVYIEKFISSPKHIEIQIFADKYGNTVHLFERECSIQRRHQKIIEESPSPSITPEIRKKMGEVAVTAAQSINYVGAGTFEFIFDNKTKEFFFMEMNTRLQVEHPVTEAVTGVDLVAEQILTANGEKLSWRQEDLKIQGHAIECRICAEDPETFIPSPGKIVRFRPPAGPQVRVDTYVFSGYEVPIQYDSMIAKLITWGKTRREAIKRMNRSLIEFKLTGVKSNIVLHKSIIKNKLFLNGEYTTQFCEKDLKMETPDLFKFVDDRVFLISAALSAYKDREKKPVERKKSNISPWKISGRKKGTGF